MNLCRKEGRCCVFVNLLVCFLCLCVCVLCVLYVSLRLAALAFPYVRTSVSQGRRKVFVLIFLPNASRFSVQSGASYIAFTKFLAFPYVCTLYVGLPLRESTHRRRAPGVPFSRGDPLYTKDWCRESSRPRTWSKKRSPWPARSGRCRCPSRSWQKRR